MRTEADIEQNAPFSRFLRQARQQVGGPGRLNRLFCARAVPIIPIQLTGRRAAVGPMHPTDATGAERAVKLLARVRQSE